MIRRGLMSKRKQKRNNGWIMAEVLVSIGVLGVLFFVYSKTFSATGKVNKMFMSRQRCLAAATALDGLAITGQLADIDTFKRLWPGLEFSIEETDGRDQWNGLKLITSTASDKSSGRDVKVQVCRYAQKRQEQ